jgi:hypothetical protein
MSWDRIRCWGWQGRLLLENCPTTADDWWGFMLAALWVRVHIRARMRCHCREEMLRARTWRKVVQLVNSCSGSRSTSLEIRGFHCSQNLARCIQQYRTD